MVAHNHYGDISFRCESGGFVCIIAFREGDRGRSSSCSDSCEWRHDIGGSAAIPVKRYSIGEWTDDCYALYVVGTKGKDIVLVLQKHNGLIGDLTHQSLSLGPVPWIALCLIDRANFGVGNLLG